MNKEKIINDVYKSYQKEINRKLENWIDIQEGDIYEGTSLDDSGRVWTKEEFINKCKTDSEFSEKWGLKIEERELSLEERVYNPNWGLTIKTGKPFHIRPENSVIDDGINKAIFNACELNNIPKRAITLMYNNETIENYE